MYDFDPFATMLAEQAGSTARVVRSIAPSSQGIHMLVQPVSGVVFPEGTMLDQYGPGLVCVLPA